MTASHGDGGVWVAVSHGDLIKAVLADALGALLAEGAQLVLDRAVQLEARHVLVDRRLGQPPLRGDETRASALLGRCRLSLTTAVTRPLPTALGVAPPLSTLTVRPTATTITLVRASLATTGAVRPTLTITLVRAPLTVSLLVGPTLAPLTVRTPATAITLVGAALPTAGT